MMRIIIFTIIAICISTSATAQELIDDYMQYKFGYSQYDSQYQDFDAEQLLDTLHSHQPIPRHNDKFGELTSYAFSFVRYSRRGADYTSTPILLDGIHLRAVNSSIVSRLGLSEREFGGIAHGEQGIGILAGSREFSMLNIAPQNSANIGLFLSGKGYLGGIRASMQSVLNYAWSMSAYVAARGGDDLYINGVYNDAVDVGVRFTRDFHTEATFSLLYATTISQRGMRSGSTQEAFRLRGDNLYNPLWGRQEGKVRNSRVRRDAVPFAVAAYRSHISENTLLTLSAGGHYGKRSTSSLGWYGAMTPRPDNYRYMPSYFADSALAEIVAAEWRMGNEKYTQINWEDLYNLNSKSHDGAVYALDDRVERIARGEVVMRMSSTISPQLSIAYGIRAWIDSSRNYKRMRDLMGADYLIDLDYFLIDDDSFSNSLQNDKRNPNRKITPGDRFSYDYALIERGVEANLQIEYNMANWRVNADMAIGSLAALRRGYFEKELFEGNRSFGRSAVTKFTPYTLKVATTHLFSAHHLVAIHGVLATRAPYSANMFLNPQYNNRLADNISMERFAAIEMNYAYTSEKFDATAAIYLQSHRNQRQTFRAYDDLSGVFCDVDVAGFGTLGYGVEATAEYSISRNLRASAALSVGRYIYSKNPQVTHYSDTDNRVVSLNSESFMEDCHIGGAPQLLGAISLSYFTYKGWSASLSAQFAAFRYVDAGFVRRTERILAQAPASKEILRQFTQQQRLNDAATIDASISRWFRLPKGRIVATLSVKNLLGDRNIVYNAYESTRIRNYMSGEQRVFLPQDNILTYAYPRTFYAIISWKF